MFGKSKMINYICHKNENANYILLLRIQIHVL